MTVIRSAYVRRNCPANFARVWSRYFAAFALAFINSRFHKSRCSWETFALLGCSAISSTEFARCISSLIARRQLAGWIDRTFKLLQAVGQSREANEIRSFFSLSIGSLMCSSVFASNDKRYEAVSQRERKS